jgi:hypothetical protein
MQRLGVQLILSSSAARRDPAHDPDLEDDEEAYLPSFRKDATGVDSTIWVSTKGKGRHGQRVEVAIEPPDTLSPCGGRTASVAFTGEVVAGDIPSSKLLRQLRQFIDLNKDVLEDYWEFRIDDRLLNERLRSI